MKNIDTFIKWEQPEMVEIVDGLSVNKKFVEAAYKVIEDGLREALAAMGQLDLAEELVKAKAEIKYLKRELKKEQL